MTSVAPTRTGRSVKDEVDGGGIYSSRFVTAGPYAFLGGVAVDETGQIAKEALVDAPYDTSPSAHAVAQTRYLFSRYKQLLEEHGSTINDVLQVEQFIAHKVHADGYLSVSRGDGFMDTRRPTS